MSARNAGLWQRVDDVFGRFEWYAVARKEFQDTIRSLKFLILATIFIAVFSSPAVAVLGGLIQVQGQGQAVSTDIALQMMKELTSVFIPLIGIIVGYGAITRERESGTLKILLSLPNSRRDVVLGKVIGRAFVIVVPILLGFLVGGLGLALTSLTFHVTNYVLFALLTALLGLVFTGLGVGISAGVSTNFRSMIISVVLFVNFVVFWNTWVGNFAQQLGKHAGISQLSQLRFILLGKLLNPTQAYKTLVGSLVRSSGEARLGLFGFRGQQVGCEQLLQGTATRQGLFGIECQVGALPVQYSDPAVVVYLLLWLVGPVALGYWYFTDRDL